MPFNQRDDSCSSASEEKYEGLVARRSSLLCEDGTAASGGRRRLNVATHPDSCQFLEDRVAFSRAERIKPSKLASMVSGVGRGRCDATFVDPRTAILSLFIAFQKEYNEKFVATVVMNIVIDAMGSAFLAGRSAKFYYQSIQKVKVVLLHDSFLALLEGLNSNISVSKRLTSPVLMTLCCAHRPRRSSQFSIQQQSSL